MKIMIAETEVGCITVLRIRTCWYTAVDEMSVDEMSVDEMSVDELSRNLFKHITKRRKLLPLNSMK